MVTWWHSLGTHLEENDHHEEHFRLALTHRQDTAVPSHVLRQDTRTGGQQPGALCHKTHGAVRIAV